jgi:acetyl-CoA synthetase
MFEGVPSYPDTGRFWDIVDRHQVNIFYTAPTALRALMREGEAPVHGTQPQIAAPARHGGRADQPGSLALVSLRRWAKGRCPIVDTWWQTETGGTMIAPLPGRIGMKPGSAPGRPFFGIRPQLVDADGAVIADEGDRAAMYRAICASPR